MPTKMRNVDEGVANMKRRISVCILIMVFTLGVVCGCSSSELENNEVALCYEDLSDEAKEVFDAVNKTEFGKKYRRRGIHRLSWPFIDYDPEFGNKYWKLCFYGVQTIERS